MGKQKKRQETPATLKRLAGYTLASPWLTTWNKHLELMGRFMAELGLRPASRLRLTTSDWQGGADLCNIGVLRIERVVISRDKDGNLAERMLDPVGPGQGPAHRTELDTRL